MSKLLAVIGAFLVTSTLFIPWCFADQTPVSCGSFYFGAALRCGGTYVVGHPGAPKPSRDAPGAKTVSSPARRTPGCVPASAAARIGSFGIFGVTVCPKPTPANNPPVNPFTLAEQFWQNVPLPVPRPTVPPGYAITGKPAYLVTGGTTHPASFVRQTPLGPLTITATGSYEVDWGDGSSPLWCGPYAEEGRPWPNGNIAHTFDNVGYYDIALVENWTATWSLAGQTGTLGGLHTTATIPRFHAEQVEAINVN